MERCRAAGLTPKRLCSQLGRIEGGVAALMGKYYAIDAATAPDMLNLHVWHGVAVLRSA